MDLTQLTEWITSLDGQVWQPFAMPLVLVIVGGLLTVATGFVQIRRFPVAMRMVMKGAFAKSAEGSKTITPFQALSTALASTVGNGNIGGVATAILIGGPGAIFWMWVTATVGMATKYAEAVLGVHYRVTRENGDLASGPMYYITRGRGGGIGGISNSAPNPSGGGGGSPAPLDHPAPYWPAPYWPAPYWPALAAA